MARVASMQRLSRILVMVPWVIQHPDQATVEAVCRRFGIDEGTLTEDITLLMMCGIPPFSPGDLIEGGIEGGRVVIRMADYLARPLRLTRWEALSVLAAGRAIAGVPGIEEAAALQSGLKKLAAAIAPDEAAAAEILAERVAIDLEPPTPEVIESLREAIEQQGTVRMEYYTLGRDEVTQRDVDPLLVFGSRPWYLLAHDHRSGGRRTFRVDRIRSATPTGATFQRPEGFDPAKEAVAPLYHPASGDMTVVLELEPAAGWVAEVTPHDKAEPIGEGRIRLTLHAGGTAWLEHLLVMLGPDARVLEPASLRQAVRQTARRALARYEES